jgi:hypothetical protein
MILVDHQEYAALSLSRHTQLSIIAPLPENGFVWEFRFNSVVNHRISGCRYRYPPGSSDKGACLSFVGF